MLNITDLNHSYYVRDFADMRCKHLHVLSIIPERLHREPIAGDVYIMMSRNRRIVRMFSFDNHSYSLFEKKFVANYQFLKVKRSGSGPVYRIDWKDLVLMQESPIARILKIRNMLYFYSVYSRLFCTFMAGNQIHTDGKYAVYGQTEKGIAAA